MAATGNEIFIDLGGTATPPKARCAHLAAGEQAKHFALVHLGDAKTLTVELCPGCASRGLTQRDDAVVLAP